MVRRVEKARTKALTTGILLFAFNTEKFDYVKMAEYSARRIQTWLNLPITLVTNVSPVTIELWDNVVIVPPPPNNTRDWGVWLNMNRYMAYDLSPYDTTILLDVDYVVNSSALLKVLELPTDFACHNKTSFVMQPNLPQEVLSVYSFETLWATVIMFKKGTYSRSIFDCIKMIQENYDHYANIHSFVNGSFRNDYALTLAHRIVNGHLITNENFIPWNLLHVGNDTKLLPNGSNFVAIRHKQVGARTKQEYITLDNVDFHCMNKQSFMDIVSC